MFRIVTYNVHKCRGLDRRVRPVRIASVLRALDADVIALQEVLMVGGGAREADQARFIAEELGYHCAVGANRRLKGGAYGNVVLSRRPPVAARNYDITWRWCERRGCQRVDFAADAARAQPALHVFNVHLGTAFVERRHQGRRLLSREILRDPALTGARVVLGDFNEWTRGLASRLLAAEFESADLRAHTGRTRTYPWALPVVHLDHVYYDRALRLTRLALDTSFTARVASDHLPLVADFESHAPAPAAAGGTGATA
ncbi:MAG TPA: endonuclease/exonuclease/phosphatase family protein [Pyrinomonadaceae bacterium]|jgi:endonuclease/exonuclease/phosphatase family metal-dependent hydrolase